MFHNTFHTTPNVPSLGNFDTSNRQFTPSPAVSSNDDFLNEAIRWAKENLAPRQATQNAFPLPPWERAGRQRDLPRPDRLAQIWIKRHGDLDDGSINLEIEIHITHPNGRRDFIHLRDDEVDEGYFSDRVLLSRRIAQQGDRGYDHDGVFFAPFADNRTHYTWDVTYPALRLRRFDRQMEKMWKDINHYWRTEAGRHRSRDVAGHLELLRQFEKLNGGWARITLSPLNPIAGLPGGQAADELVGPFSLSEYARLREKNYRTPAWLIAVHRVLYQHWKTRSINVPSERIHSDQEPKSLETHEIVPDIVETITALRRAVAPK